MRERPRVGGYHAHVYYGVMGGGVSARKGYGHSGGVVGGWGVVLWGRGSGFVAAFSLIG